MFVAVGSYKFELNEFLYLLTTLFLNKISFNFLTIFSHKYIIFPPEDNISIFDKFLTDQMIFVLFYSCAKNGCSKFGYKNAISLSLSIFFFRFIFLLPVLFREKHFLKRDENSNGFVYVSSYFQQLLSFHTQSTIPRHELQRIYITITL